MKKQIFVWLIPLLVVSSIVVFSIDESRAFIIDIFFRVFIFVKQNIFAILTAFFLVKGKFILTLFLKKIAFLSVTGLGKRYMIEKVITHNFKIHFLNHISDDIKRLIIYVKKNFTKFPLVKQIISGFVFLGSLGFVGKFMGGMLAMKVFLAQFWSLLLAIFLKVSTAIMYFFTDYLWGSWIAPIVEVVIFTWLLSWMEKIPFLAKGLNKIYAFSLSTFKWVEYFLEKIFHMPVQGFLRWLVKKIQNSIHYFIGHARVSAWKRLKLRRTLNPNSHIKLMHKREKRRQKRKESTYTSPRARLQNKRKMKQEKSNISTS